MQVPQRPGSDSELAIGTVEFDGCCSCSGVDFLTFFLPKRNRDAVKYLYGHGHRFQLLRASVLITCIVNIAI